MARFQIEAGTRFIKDGVELLVAEVQKDQRIVFEHVKHRTRWVESRCEVERQFLAGELTLISVDDDQPKLSATPLDLMTEDQQAIVRRREQYILELDKAATVVSVRSCVEEVIEAVAKELDDPEPPSRSTVSEWYRRWFKASKSVAALAPHYSRRGGQKTVMSAEVENLVLEGLEERYLVREQPTLKDVAKTYILPDLRTENDSRDPKVFLVRAYGAKVGDCIREDFDFI